MRELPGVLRSAALRFLVQPLLPGAELPLSAAAQFRTGNPAEYGEKSSQEPVQTALKPISAQSTAIPRGVVHLHRFRPYPEFPSTGASSVQSLFSLCCPERSL
jgi:hypothetical protein